MRNISSDIKLGIILSKNLNCYVVGQQQWRSQLRPSGGSSKPPLNFFKFFFIYIVLKNYIKVKCKVIKNIIVKTLGYGYYYSKSDLSLLKVSKNTCKVLLKIVLEQLKYLFGVLIALLKS